MYKIIRYKDDLMIHQVISDVLEVVVDDNKISWKDTEGQKEIQGDSLYFIVVDNNEPHGDHVTQELIQKDKKHTLKSEIDHLKSQLSDTQSALDFVLLG